MDSSLTRRDALKGMISAGTIALVQPAKSLERDSPITLTSSQVEIALATISPQTVRITVQPIVGGEVHTPESKLRYFQGSQTSRLHDFFFGSGSNTSL